MTLSPWKPTEIMAEFARLSVESPAVLCRLRMSARRLIWRTAYDDEHELVHAALERLCRTSPPRLELPLLIYQTMRSLAHCSRNSAPQRARRCNYEEEMQLCTVSTEQLVEDLEEEDGREARNRRAIRRLRDYFTDDRHVSAILDGIAADKKARAIRPDAGMTLDEYNSAHRRLRRGLDKLFPDRRTHNL